MTSFVSSMNNIRVTYPPWDRTWVRSDFRLRLRLKPGERISAPKMQLLKQVNSSIIQSCICRHPEDCRKLHSVACTIYSKQQ